MEGLLLIQYSLASLIFVCINDFGFDFRQKFKIPHVVLWLGLLCPLSLSLSPLIRVHTLFFRIRNCLTQLYAKDITPDDKQEIDEALQREVIIKTHFTLCTINS